jgi:hypothetical protein
MEAIKLSKGAFVAADGELDRPERSTDGFRGGPPSIPA